MRGLFACAVGVLTIAVLLVASAADGQDKKQDKKAKYKIAEVMAKAMKGKDALLNKVVEGKATAEEKETLIELFEALHANAPPEGSKEKWQQRTKAILDAAKLAKTEARGAAALKKLANCMACHSEHKPKDE